MEYVCAYYVWQNDTYEREGMRGVEMGESRGVCSSTHTTSFAVVAVVDQAKTDDMQRVTLTHFVHISSILCQPRVSHSGPVRLRINSKQLTLFPTTLVDTLTANLNA